jgi:hypothetical protein
VTTFRDGTSDVRIVVEARDFSLSKTSMQTLCARQRLIQWVPGGGGLNRPGRDIDNSLPCSAEVKSEQNCILLLLYTFMEYTWAT